MRLAVRGSNQWNAILRATHANQFFTDAPTIVYESLATNFAAGGSSR